MGRHADRLKKRGNLWWTWFYVPEVQPDGRVTKRKREASTGQRDRALAREAARRIEHEAVAIVEGPEPLYVENAIASYLARAEAGGRTADTLAYYEKKAKPLVRVLGARTEVHRLDMTDADAYAAKRRTEGVANATIAKELGFLRSTLKAARKRGLYQGDPVWCLPEDLRGAYVPRDTAITHAQYLALRSKLSPERQEYLAAYCGLGVRHGELARIEAIDVEKGRVHVRGHKGKKDRADRWLTPTAEVMKILRARSKRTPAGPLFPEWANVRRDLKNACIAAEVPRVSPNDLRRSFATWLAEKGVGELITGAIMGHANSSMLRRVYARVGIEAKVLAMSKLPSLTAKPKRTKRAA